MPTIRIDHDVMGALQERAVKEGLVFGSPNQVLRVVLGLDFQTGKVEGVRLPINQVNQTQLRNPAQPRTRRVTGRRVLRAHEDLPQNLRPYSDRDGTFYEWPVDFPAILFNNGGYIIFDTEESLRRADGYLTLYPDTRKIHVQETIGSIPGYVKCDHNHNEWIFSE